MSTAYSTTQFLPSGVESRFDPKSGKHYYVNQGHYNQSSTTTATTTTTTTTLSWDEPKAPSEFTTIPLQDMTNRSLDKSSMVQVDENLCKKLAGLFPSVQEDDLRILCKRSYNNESIAMGDLTARGFRPMRIDSYRSTYSTTTPPMTTTTLTSNYAKTVYYTTSGAGNTMPTNTLSNNYTSSGFISNSVASADWSSTAPPQWMNAIRRTQSPLVNPQRMTSLTHGGSPSSSGSGSPVPTLQRPCYYPGRFVQGVGFEPSSMGGAPHVAGKPFAPLQGRYALSGMITEKSSSPRTHRIQTIPRDPNYGHLGSRVLSQSLAYPGMVGVSGDRGLTGNFSSSQYSYTVSHAMPPPPPPPTSAMRSSYGYHHQHGPPIPSWYGEDDHQLTGSPQAPLSPRLYSVVHDAFVGRNNRVTDRSASPPVLPPATRTYSPTTSYYSNSGRERTPTPPNYPYYQYQYQQSQQPYHPHQTNQSPNPGGSFYATASRLYAQSPKAARRATNMSGNSSYGGGGDLIVSSTPSPLPHYQVPPRTSQIPASAIYSQQQQAYSNSRTYSPQTIQHHPYQPPTMLERMQVGHESAFPPVRSSPGPHSPKIKLRYLRRIYPGVDETVLLDILANADNNVQTAMTELSTMGYVKVDTPPVRPASVAHHQHQQPQQSQLTSSKQDTSRLIGRSPQLFDRPVAPPRRLTEADKQKTRARMLEKVKEIPVAILTIALESVDFDEERAMLLLTNMNAEDKMLNGIEGGTSSINGQFEEGVLSAEALQNKLSGFSKSHIVPVRKSQSEDRKDVIMLSKGTWTQEDLQFRSRFKSEPKGTDTNLRRGPNKELLTNDLFAVCKGPNTEIRKGRNPELLLTSQPPPNEEIQPIVDSFLKAKEQESAIKARGPEQGRHQGPQRSLIQGSTYQFPY